jgi:hypothetical protein
MSLISQYTAYEQQIHYIREQMKKLETDSRMKSELEFKKKVEELMLDYDKHPSELVEMFGPRSGVAGITGKATRKPRKLKIFKNPETGEVCETRGGNNKVLRTWKEQYGSDAVESWLVNVEG